MASTKDTIAQLKARLLHDLRVEDGYEITSDVRWGSTSSNIVVDLVVRKNTFLLAIFDIVKSTSLVTHGRSFFIRHISPSSDEKPPIIITFCTENNIYSVLFPPFIQEELGKKYPKRRSDSIFREFKRLDEVIQLIKDASEIIDSKAKARTIEVNTDEKQLKFYESTDKVLEPDWCRDQLGVATCRDEKSKKKIPCEEICRYSSLDSLFSSLKFKTIRMNGLPGMNDRNEGLFAWNMIYKLDNTENEENKKRRRETNNAFIVSYSSSNLIDDLTQWRLYGDDAKGVCCVYSILQDRLKDRFFLHNVRYIKESDKNEEIIDELLHRFLEYSKDHSDLSYYDLSPAIFFYKPDSYKSEDEIRLLVDNKKTTAYKYPEYKREWLLTDANSIPNPYIDIPYDDIPLKLERIILGPNMNDVDTIQAQLETLLEQQGINAIVELSSIKSYRNSDK